MSNGPQFNTKTGRWMIPVQAPVEAPEPPATYDHLVSTIEELRAEVRALTETLDEFMKAMENS